MTDATAASHVAGNPYSITASAAADPDYAITYAPGTLTVTPTSLTITAADHTKVYGAALPSLTATYSGFVNNDSPASLSAAPILTTNATAASHVASGPYAISASSAVDPDYAITYLPGSLSVTQAPLTITAADQSKVYGAALPTLTATYSGLVNGDTSTSLSADPTLTTDATAASHVAGNPYSIMASAAADPDYAITYAPGTLTVTPAPLTITAAHHTKVYGAALPTLTASYSGFVNGDTSAIVTTPPTLTTVATAASHVSSGPYAITASGAVADPDYAITYVPGSLTVTPATLTVTPNHATKVSGDPVPTLTATYTGFVNDDTAADLSTPVVLSTTATAASPIGTYPINASGGSSPDYSFVYGQGSLAVTADPANTTFVTALYKGILGRTPDPGGLNGFVSDLEQGVSKLAVTTAIYNSGEATTDRANSGTPANPLGPKEIDLVIALYQDILGRAPEQAGLDGWLAEFEAGANAAQVAAAIQNSAEAVADQANPPMPGAGRADRPDQRVVRGHPQSGPEHHGARRLSGRPGRRPERRAGRRRHRGLSRGPRLPGGFGLRDGPLPGHPRPGPRRRRVQCLRLRLATGRQQAGRDRCDLRLRRGRLGPGQRRDPNQPDGSPGDRPGHRAVSGHPRPVPRVRRTQRLAG